MGQWQSVASKKGNRFVLTQRWSTKKIARWAVLKQRFENDGRESRELHERDAFFELLKQIVRFKDVRIENIVLFKYHFLWLNRKLNNYLYQSESVISRYV